MIGWLAPSELDGVLSSAVGTSFGSISGFWAGEVSPTGSVESLGSLSTSIFYAVLRPLLSHYLYHFSRRYDLSGICWPSYRLQPWPWRILIGAPRSRDRISWPVSGWLAQEGGVQPLGGAILPRCISSGWVFPIC